MQTPATATPQAPALTLDSDAYMPLPAQRYGRFVWYDAKVRRRDRSALCTRGVDAAALNAAADAQRLRLALAVESVRGRVDWVAAQVDDNFRERRTRRTPLTAGHRFPGRCAIDAGQPGAACGNLRAARCDRLARGAHDVEA